MLQDNLTLLVISLQTGCIYSLIALGYVAVLHPTGIANFVQGDWAMFGAMLGVFLVADAHLPYPLAFVAIVVAIGAMALLVQQTVVKPLIARDASEHTALVVLIGVLIVTEQLAAWVFGKASRPAPTPFSDQALNLAGVYIVPQTLFVFAVTAVVVAAIWHFFERTMIGKAFRAVAIDRTAAALVGINLELVFAGSFFLAGVLGALAGLLYSPFSSANYLMGLPLAIKGFVALVLGGAERTAGAVVGGMILAAAEVFAARYIPVASGYAEAVPLMVLLLMLYFRPSGVLGPARLRAS